MISELAELKQGLRVWGGAVHSAALSGRVNHVNNQIQKPQVSSKSDTSQYHSGTAVTAQERAKLQNLLQRLSTLP